MSRLDDELKIAFQRQEPSPDFAARVLARINEAPVAQAQPSLWQRLSGWLAMPAWRFAAVTAVALLLILVGLALLRSQRTTTVGNESSPQAVVPPQTDATQNGDNKTAQQESAERIATMPQARAVKISRQIHHHAPVIARQAPPSAEAVAAKEKVMFALQITSEALNDVQRAISDERSRDENPEPVHNR
jgi:type VI protein secretion system component VasF